jgi:hypothetical protein
VRAAFPSFANSSSSSWSVEAHRIRLINRLTAIGSDTE